MSPHPDRNQSAPVRLRDRLRGRVRSILDSAGATAGTGYRPVVPQLRDYPVARRRRSW
jgi:hypothetical protein